MALKFPAALGAACILLAASGTAQADTYNIRCDYTSASKFFDRDQGIPKSSTQHGSRKILVDPDADTVTVFEGDAPKLISDVRILDHNRVVFCENEATHCVAHTRVDTDPARFQTYMSTSLTYIDLKTGELTYDHQLTRTHIASGDYIEFSLTSRGTCEKSAD